MTTDAAKGAIRPTRRKKNGPLISTRPLHMMLIPGVILVAVYSYLPMAGIVMAFQKFDIFKGTRHHPYTIGLFGSIPSVRSESKRLSPIGGLMPDPTELPQGCRFSPRCPRSMDICHSEHPAEHITGTHKIRCHLYTERGAR